MFNRLPLKTFSYPGNVAEEDPLPYPLALTGYTNRKKQSVSTVHFPPLSHLLYYNLSTPQISSSSSSCSVTVTPLCGDYYFNVTKHTLMEGSGEGDSAAIKTH